MTRVTGVRLIAVLSIVFGLGIVAGRSAPPVPSAPAWVAAGSLDAPRAYGSAVALATGEVLVLGGLDATDPQVTRATSELFDPASGAVTVLPQRLPGRLNYATATGWGDRVVVTGGTEWRDGSWAAFDRVDVFLPEARTWLRGAPLRVPRSDHAAVALADGRILVVGGHDGPRWIRGSEIYDPRTNTWAPAAPLPKGRAQFTMQTLPNGLVLAVGGIEDPGRPSRTSLLYDPATDRWRAGPDLSIERVLHAAARLPNGDVLIVGGQGAAGASAERYDWRLNTIAFAGTLVAPRYLPAAAALPDGRVIVSGGLPGDPSLRSFAPTAATEIWSGAPDRPDRWTALPPGLVARALGDLVVTDRGVYRIGGVLDGERAGAAIERLTPP